MLPIAKSEISKKDIRDSFFDELHQIGSKDHDVVIITNDMDVFSLREFKNNFPNQFINMGVAEQNMINVAAGLASCGKKVYIFGILSFVTFRCYEQIKFNICSMNLPVTIVGMGCGLSFGFDGPTHHAIQDIIVMNALPEMMILNPSDSRSAAECAHISYKARTPTYVRIDKGQYPEFYIASDNFNRGLKILREIGEINIISTGFMTTLAVEVADTLKKKGYEIGVVDIFRIKPLDKNFLIQTLCPSKKIIIVEENSSSGGLYPIIIDIINSFDKKVFVNRVGLPDEQFLSYGTREWHHDNYGLTKEKIIDYIIN